MKGVSGRRKSVGGQRGFRVVVAAGDGGGGSDGSVVVVGALWVNDRRRACGIGGHRLCGLPRVPHHRLRIIREVY